MKLPFPTKMKAKSVARQGFPEPRMRRGRSMHTTHLAIRTHHLHLSALPGGTRERLGCFCSLEGAMHHPTLMKYTLCICLVVWGIQLNTRQSWPTGNLVKSRWGDQSQIKEKLNNVQHTHAHREITHRSGCKWYMSNWQIKDTFTLALLPH